MLIPSVPPQQRALLPEGRLSGPMPWVIAILMFLTLLAGAAGLGLWRSADGIGDAIAGRVTVQIVDANPETRAATAARLRREIAAAPYVRAARDVDREALVEMMGRWFGDLEGEDDPVLRDLPMPALIDVDFVAGDADANLAALRTMLRTSAPDARATPHADWLGPVARLIRTLAWVAVALVVMMSAATAAVVMLTARAALGTHLSTIEILHLIGATDKQVTRLFQRRIGIDTAFGVALGTMVATAVMLLLGWQLSGVTSGLAATATLGVYGWLVLLALPIFTIAVGALTARWTLMSTLKKTL
jgi:cell division transport system permease protein